MRYALLIYIEGGKNLDHFIAPQLAYDRTVEASGNLQLAFALQRIDTATSVRMRDGKVSMTDGPFAETKEVLGGLYLIEAKDLDAAIAIAANMPLATVGTVEVRPLRELDELLRSQ